MNILIIDGNKYEGEIIEYFNKDFKYGNSAIDLISLTYSMYAWAVEAPPCKLNKTGCLTEEL